MSARDVIHAALVKNGWRAFADPTTDAILSALRAAGYAVVPREPTEAMLQSGENEFWKENTPEPGETYRAMIAAAEAPDA